MCGYFCIVFIDFMLKSKSLVDYTNLFSPNDYETNDKIKLKYFQYEKMKKLYCVLCGKYRKFGKLKVSYLLEKTLVLSVSCNKCKCEEKEKIFKEEESIEIIKNSWFNWKYIITLKIWLKKT